MAEATDVKVEDLMVCEACCCSLTSCFCKFPDCIGCKTEGICCCLQVEMAGLKCMDRSETQDAKCCTCFEGGAYFVIPSTCCQEQQQCCCLDIRVALPCTDKVPCMCTCCPFCVVAANYKFHLACCKKVGDIMEKVNE